MSRTRVAAPLVIAVFLLATLSGRAEQTTPVQEDGVKDRLTAVAEDFGHRVASAGFRTPAGMPAIVVETLPQISMYTNRDNTIHTARWETEPPDVQTLFNRWALYAGDTTGKQLFEDMFHRFFFVHELGHWLMYEAKSTTSDVYGGELEANRVAVAYWREEDPGYLSTVLARLRRMSDRLPDPVPAGQDAEQYFRANYRGLGSKPEIYAWFQCRMVATAADERPVLTFSQVLHRLLVR